MELTAAQQDRYSRHLLLDAFGGEGQERLLQARVRVGGEPRIARWVARYLAAAGTGTLVLEGEWAGEAARECAAQNPDVLLFVGDAASPAQRLDGAAAELSLSAGTLAGSDITYGIDGSGAWVAVAPASPPPSEHRQHSDALPPSEHRESSAALPPSAHQQSSAALLAACAQAGAFAALEAIKRIARAGEPARGVRRFDIGSAP